MNELMQGLIDEIPESVQEIIDLTEVSEDEQDMTERAVAAMKQENTGRSILDSGGAYGRRWERNQAKSLADFKAEPLITLDPEDGITISAYSWLVSCLEYAPDLNAEVALVDEELGGREAWEDVGKAWLATHEDWEVLSSGLTYNEDEGLYFDNGFSWDILETYEWDHYVVSIRWHGGCDIRGGYTKPYLFRMYSENGYSPLMEYGWINMRCEDGHEGDRVTDGQFGNEWHIDVYQGESASSEFKGDWTKCQVIGCDKRIKYVYPFFEHDFIHRVKNDQEIIYTKEAA